ncbi:MAG: hypothetical protein ACE5I1_00870 [bacterium]
MNRQQNFMLLVISLCIFACKNPFPPAQKQGIPDDHTVSIKGAMHKEGFKYPYKQASGCSASECHHDDLDGGVAVVDSVQTVAPSCFQCHNTKWQDDTDE